MNHLEKAQELVRPYGDDVRNGEAFNIESIAHAAIAIAKELKIANNLKRLELKGTPGFKIKPNDLNKLFLDV